MEIKLHSPDSLRVEATISGVTGNFIDLSTDGLTNVAIDLYPSFYYIEIRQKDGFLKLFTFPKKSMKKCYDFGYWDDAEVVFSNNTQTHNK